MVRKKVYFSHRPRWKSLPSGIAEIPGWDKAEEFQAEEIRTWPLMLPTVPPRWPERRDSWGALGIIQWWVYVFLGLNSVDVSDFQALTVPLYCSPLRHLGYMILHTYLLLIIINWIQLNQIMITWWHSLGSLWMPLSMPMPGFWIRDYRLLFQMVCPGTVASSSFVALELVCSSTDKQKMQLSPIITSAVGGKSLYSGIPFPLGGMTKSAADITCPFVELPWRLIFVFLPKNLPLKNGQMPDTAPGRNSRFPPSPAQKHSGELPLKSCMSFLDCVPACAWLRPLTAEDSIWGSDICSTMTTRTHLHFNETEKINCHD